MQICPELRRGLRIPYSIFHLPSSIFHLPSPRLLSSRFSPCFKTQQRLVKPVYVPKPPTRIGLTTPSKFHHRHGCDTQILTPTHEPSMQKRRSLQPMKENNSRLAVTAMIISGQAQILPGSMFQCSILNLLIDAVRMKSFTSLCDMESIIAPCVKPTDAMTRVSAATESD